MYEKRTAAFLAVLVVLSGGSAFVSATGTHEGATGSRTVAAEANFQQQSGQVLVFADDYTPGTSFQVITRLKQGAVRDILGQTVDDRPIISEPTDYSGYVVSLHSSENVPGEYGLVFVDREEGRLVRGSQYQFEADATFFRTEVNLLQTGIRSVGGDTTPEAETTTPEEGTPTATPESNGSGANEMTATTEETTTAVEETGEALAVAETTTAAEAQENGGFISGVVDFFSGLFGGGGEDAQETTTVESGVAE